MGGDGGRDDHPGYGHRRGGDADGDAGGARGGRGGGLRRRAWRRLAEGLRRLAGLARPPADADAEPSAAMEGCERAERVRRAVRALPARDREVIVLHHLEGRPVEEVARVLGVRRNAAEVRLHRARRRLRELLTGPGEAEVW